MSFNVLIFSALGFLAIMIMADKDIKSIELFAFAVSNLFTAIFSYLRGRNDQYKETKKKLNDSQKDLQQ